MPADCLALPAASAMKGVILTAIGEPVVIPTPLKLMDLLINLSRVGHSLRFARIFDFDKADEDKNH